MKRRSILIWSAMLLPGLCAFPPARSSADGSASNGVYGGYVGSDAWFSAMRQSAANQAMLRSLSGQRSAHRLPPGYVEVAGQIRFPAGNPFPHKRLPDLRIQCRSTKADGVERAPFLGTDGSFYTALKRGQTYDLYWMGYFGGREKFGSIVVATAGPARRKLTIAYRPAAAARQPDPAPLARPVSPDAAPAAGAPPPPVDADAFDLSGFPTEPATFEEQQVAEAIHSATTPALKSDAHARLSRYYEKRGDAARTKAERAKAAYWSR